MGWFIFCVIVIIVIAVANKSKEQHSVHPGPSAEDIRLTKLFFNSATKEESEVKKIEEKERKIEEKQRKVNAKKRRVARLQRILSKTSIINKFLEITYRKVSVIDEYGDEDWSILNEEILKCIFKVVQQSKKELSWASFRDNPSIYFNNADGLDIEDLKEILKEKFKAYYKTKKRGSGKNINVKELSGVEFETFFSKVLKENGYTDVSGTPATGDQGADILAKKNGKTIVIQAKRWEGTVGNKAVQEVIGAMKFYGGDEGWVVTNSLFTSSAKALAQKANIRLVDGNDLKEWVNKKGE